DGILKPMSSAPVFVRLGPQGRLVVPVDIRRELSLDEGSELTIRSDGRRLILEPRAEVLRRLRGRFQRPTDEGASLADELPADGWAPTTGLSLGDRACLALAATVDGTAVTSQRGWIAAAPDVSVAAIR